MKKILFLILIVILAIPAISEAKKEVVLVIESYHAGYPWDASYKRGIESILADRCHLEYFEMDTKRRPSSEHQLRADLAWEQYEALKPSLVILGDDNALKFLGSKLAETDTPVVYMGINRNPRHYDMVRKKNITGVLERPLLKRSIYYLKDILDPSPRKIMVLFDDGATSKASVAEVFKGWTTLPVSGVMVQLRLIGKLKEWEKAITTAKEEGFDAVVVGLYQTLTDDQGRHVEAEQLLSWTSKKSPVPLFCFWDFAAGSDKTIGGFVLFGEAQGEAAAKMAIQILDGKKPSRIRPMIAEKGRFLFSRSQLKRWGIDLPPRISVEAEFVD